MKTTYITSLVSFTRITTACALALPAAAFGHESLLNTGAGAAASFLGLSVPSESQPLQPVSASDLMRIDLKSAANENIGEITDVFVDIQSGEILALVVSTGGFLGVAAQQSLISLDDVIYRVDSGELRSQLTKEQVQQAPRYRQGGVSGLLEMRRPETGPIASPSATTKSETTTDSGQAQRATDRDRTSSSDRPIRVDYALKVSDLKGMAIENRQGERLGSVDEVYFSLDNEEVLGLVVSTGGFLGLGDRKSVLTPSDLDYSRADDKLRANLNREQLAELSEYKEGVWVKFEETAAERAERKTGRAGTSTSE